MARAETRLSSTRGGQVKGQVPYMAPAPVQAGEIDRRTDVYAAGVVLWELLAGERLVRGEHEGERLFQILRPEQPLFP